MKAKKFFMFILAGCLVVSCSKDSLISPDQGMIQSENGAFLKLSGSVVQVFPGGTDDTQALIDAFAQADAIGNNAVVKLMAGTYKIGMIEIREFNGTLTGSGKGNTISSAVILTSYKVIRISDNTDITPGNNIVPENHGYYPIIDDSDRDWLRKNNVEVEFQGYLDNNLLIKKRLVVTADCCHVSLVSGDSVIYI